MRDSTSAGLYYIGARYMDPELGRWLSLDPQLGSLGAPQTINRYVYCVNNPLGFVDPSGAKTRVPRHYESDMSLDEFMNLIGFIPFVDTVSDLYFYAKAAYYQDWETAAFYAGCALVPALGSSYYKAGGKTIAKTYGVKWLDDLVTISKGGGKRADDVPTSPITRGADDVYEISESGFQNAYRAGDFGDMPVGLARGQYAHRLISGELPGDMRINRYLDPHSRPDAVKKGLILEIKPYKEGLNYHARYGEQVSKYTGAYHSFYKTSEIPRFEFITYRFV